MYLRQLEAFSWKLSQTKHMMKSMISVANSQKFSACMTFFLILFRGQSNMNEAEALEEPVHMGTLMDNFDNRVIDTKSIWMAKKEVSSVVDAEKLRKAEAKLREKQDKKSAQTKLPSNYQAFVVEERASVCQQVNKRDVVMDSNSSERYVNEIKLENFDISFGSRKLLSQANLTVAAGRRYGLIGRNGFGKTTLLKAISNRDLVLPQGLRIVHVEQEILGTKATVLESVLEADTERHELLTRLKNLTNSGNSDSDKEIANIHKKLIEIEADRAEANAAKILFGLGFSREMQERATKTFSGGWRMRVSLARALFCKPDLLLLDEPTNMLDMSAIIWLEDYLQTWANILIVVSHDRSFLNNISTDIIHLTNARLDLYRGNYDNFEKAREEKLLNQKREYESQKAEREHIQKFIDTFRYNAKRATLVQSRIKALEKLPPLVLPDKEPQIVINFPKIEKIGGSIVRMDEVSFHYSQDNPILEKVDLNATADSKIFIVGENGAGKTTLLKLILGQIEPTKGIRQLHRNAKIGYFSQHHVDQLELGLTSIEFLAKLFPNLDEPRYRSQLAQFGIADLVAMQPIGSLSGGQKSRVAFASMCMANPNCLVLDEPTNHLDMETIAALAEALRNFNGPAIIVSHDERLISSVCSELWICTKMSNNDEKQGSKVSILNGGIAEYKKLVRKKIIDV